MVPRRTEKKTPEEGDRVRKPPEALRNPGPGGEESVTGRKCSTGHRAFFLHFL